jgi:glycosyltransferase involved in cell wall biosynthesis
MTAISQQYFWPRALRRARIDISLFPYHLSAPLIGGGQRNVIVHDCIFEEDARYAPDRKTRDLYRLLTRAIVHRANVLTPSAASAAQITKHYRVKVGAEAVLPWGVTAAAPELSAETASARLVLPQRYYLHVGAHRPHKNVDLLIRAIAEFEPDEHLVLVGAEDERWPSAAVALARTLGVADRLVRLDSVTEAQLAQLYTGATAFLYPSLVEGFGLPLLEAMAAGVPVIASDIPVFREVAGDAALLVPPRNLPAWTHALKELRDATVRQEFIAKGYRRAQQATWQRAASRLVDALTVPSK